MSVPGAIAGAVANAAAPAVVSAFSGPSLPPELGIQGLISDARARALNAEDNASVYPWVLGGTAFIICFAIGVNVVGRRSTKQNAA